MQKQTSYTQSLQDEKQEMAAVSQDLGEKLMAYQVELQEFKVSSWC